MAPELLLDEQYDDSQMRKKQIASVRRLEQWSTMGCTGGLAMASQSLCLSASLSSTAFCSGLKILEVQGHL